MKELLIILALGELIFIFYLLSRNKKSKSALESKLNFLLNITCAQELVAENALSFKRMEKTSSKNIIELKDYIKSCYERTISRWNLNRFGEHILNLSQLTDDYKKEILLSLLKTSVEKIEPEKLAEIYISYISSMPICYCQSETIIIEHGRGLILRSVLKDGNPSDRVRLFIEKLSNGVEYLAREKLDCSEDLKVIINAEFIRVQEILKFKS